MLRHRRFSWSDTHTHPRVDPTGMGSHVVACVVEGWVPSPRHPGCRFTSRRASRPWRRASRRLAEGAPGTDVRVLAEAPAWSDGARKTSGSSEDVVKLNAAPTAVVVGGGWAGFGAAWQLIKHGFDVTLLDASPNPGGLSSGWRTTSGRAVEAGCKGFWRHYKNIHALCDELGVDPFTPYTSSAFYSPAGKEVSAPILGDLPRLPTPLGTLLYTSPYFTNLSVEDRLSAAPLAVDLLRYDATPESYARYDAMSARDLFLRGGDRAGGSGEWPLLPPPLNAWLPGLGNGGASPALYESFLAPILCALMFAPPEELSAAAALDVLYGRARDPSRRGIPPSDLRSSRPVLPRSACRESSLELSVGVPAGE